MKSILILPLMLALSTLAGAGTVNIYQIDLKGPLPAVSDLPSALPPAGMPSMKAYTGTSDAQGNFRFDLTDKIIPSPDPEAREPRRLGILVTGTVTPNPAGEPSARIKFRIRECRHQVYAYGAADRRFYPSWTESSMEMIGAIDKSGWAVIDSDPAATEGRTVYFVRIGSGAT
jgi:hypothetical protein